MESHARFHDRWCLDHVPSERRRQWLALQPYFGILRENVLYHLSVKSDQRHHISNSHEIGRYIPIPSSERPKPIMNIYSVSLEANRVEKSMSRLEEKMSRLAERSEELIHGYLWEIEEELLEAEDTDIPPQFYKVHYGDECTGEWQYDPPPTPSGSTLLGHVRFKDSLDRKQRTSQIRIDFTDSHQLSDIHDKFNHLKMELPTPVGTHNLLDIPRNSVKTTPVPSPRDLANDVTIAKDAMTLLEFKATTPEFWHEALIQEAYARYLGKVNQVDNRAELLTFSDARKLVAFMDEDMAKVAYLRHKEYHDTMHERLHEAQSNAPNELFT